MTIGKALSALCDVRNWDATVLDSEESRYAAAFLTQYAHIGEKGVVFPEPSIVLDEDIASLLRPTTTGLTAVLFVKGLKELARLGLIELRDTVILVRQEFTEVLEVQTFQQRLQVEV